MPKAGALRLARERGPGWSWGAHKGNPGVGVHGLTRHAVLGGGAVLGAWEGPRHPLAAQWGCRPLGEALGSSRCARHWIENYARCPQEASGQSICTADQQTGAVGLGKVM